VAVITGSGLLIVGVGDSPAYVDFGTGFELVSEAKRTHALKEWLGSTEHPVPWTMRWPADHDIRGVVTTDGVDPAAVSSLSANRSAVDLAADLGAVPALGGDDASAAIAVLLQPSDAVRSGASTTHNHNHKNGQTQ